MVRTLKSYQLKALVQVRQAFQVEPIPRPKWATEVTGNAAVIWAQTDACVHHGPFLVYQPMVQAL